MEISGIAAMATEMSQTKNIQAVQIAVLKKAMDMQGQSALQLVLSATQPSNPANLGNGVDVFA